MMFKRMLVGGIIAGALLFAGGCSTVEPKQGQEAVLIKKPMFFGHGGVEKEPIKTGLEYVALTTDHVIVEMTPIQKTVHFDDLMSSDGVPLDFDAVIRLQVTDSVRLVEKFGDKWYESNVEQEFRNRVRQAVRKHGMNETAINTTAIEQIDTEVTDSMVTYLKAAGLPLNLIQVTVGKANPPDSIKNQRIETAAQQQRALTEHQGKLAEDQRKERERSRAEADNAYREAMQLNPEQYLRLKSIEMQRDACGAGHCTFFFGGSPTLTQGVK